MRANFLARPRRIRRPGMQTMTRSAPFDRGGICVSRQHGLSDELTEFRRRGLTRLRTSARSRRSRACQALLARAARAMEAADQADANQGKAIEEGFLKFTPAARNELARAPSTTRRFASSVPTVRRSALRQACRLPTWPQASGRAWSGYASASLAEVLALLVSGKWMSTKLATLGVIFKPELGNFIHEPGDASACCARAR